MESCVPKSGVKQMFTWSTPFFDVQFVDIKTKKGGFEKTDRFDVVMDGNITFKCLKFSHNIC
jgi:hypothetical protein